MPISPLKLATIGYLPAPTEPLALASIGYLSSAFVGIPDDVITPIQLEIDVSRMVMSIQTSLVYLALTEPCYLRFDFAPVSLLVDVDDSFTTLDLEEPVRVEFELSPESYLVFELDGEISNLEVSLEEPGVIELTLDKEHNVIEIESEFIDGEV